MILTRRTSTMIVTGMLLVFASPLWADRDDGGFKSDHKDVPRDYRKAPPRETGQAPIKQSPPVRTQPPRAEPAPTVRKITPPPRNAQPAPVYRTAPAPTVRKVTPPPAGYVLDKRYNHNHYYPPRGHEVTILPATRHVIRYRDGTFYYSDGVWYRPSGTRYIVIRPPIGILVPFLPSFYTILWVGAIPYYYAGGVYYAWYPEYHSYAVAEPPPESEVRVDEAGTDQLFIYPKLGQSEAQQARDRYECHVWAVSQTGFDPTLPGGGVPEDQHRDKRADYFRAMKACLEARNYSVQ